MPGHDVDLVDLHLTLQPHGRGLGNQAAAQLLGHGVHVRHVEAQFLGDLTVRKVQTHEVQAQHPDPQRLVMAGHGHLAYKPEHAVDLDSGAVIAAEVHPADQGDTTTLPGRWPARYP